MIGSAMKAGLAFAVVAASALVAIEPVSAQSVMQQCGQQYQAAKAGGTLNGMTWNQFRTDCAAKLKAQPASASTGAAAAPAAAPISNPLKPAPAVPEATSAAAAPVPTSPVAPAGAGKTPSAGRTAFVARERQCGTEWKANKVSLKAQTPGLTWPKYLSQCNTRLKAAGQ